MSVGNNTNGNNHKIINGMARLQNRVYLRKMDFSTLDSETVRLVEMFLRDIELEISSLKRKTRNFRNGIIR
jgi:hypothetical protein